jgi:sugar (pentulose or hexulose) kinase
MQLLADVTQLPLRVPKVVEAGVLGAAIFGGVAAGVVAPDTASSQMVHIGRTYTPNVALAARYDALYTRYCQLDDLLAPWFRANDPGATTAEHETMH